MNEGRLILKGSTDQVVYTAKLAHSLAHSTPFWITLVMLEGSDSYEAIGAAYVRGVSRDPRAMTVSVELELISITHEAPLSTTWNAVEEGAPRLRFTASSHPDRPEQWDLDGQLDGPEFSGMAAR